MRTAIAVAVAKIFIAVLRLFGLGGTSFPGKVALFIHPSLLGRLAENLEVTMITGTNGKTTTTKILSTILDNAGIPYISNRSGANLLNGVVAALAEKCTLSGAFKEKIALLELDEAAFKIACKYIKPRFVIVTNFFKDQLDRYNNQYTAFNAVKKGLNSTGRNAVIILNADDSLCSSLSFEREGRVKYFGISREAANADEATVADNAKNQNTTDSDLTFCLKCNERLDYTYRTYGHLGGYSCPNCGNSRPEPDVYCTDIISKNVDETIVNISVKAEAADNYSFSSIGIDVTANAGEIVGADASADGTVADADGVAADGTVADGELMENVKIALPGLYNIYNALSAIACGVAMGIDKKIIRDAVGSFRSGFGRMEIINCDGRFVRLILVKNPVGFNQVLRFLSPIKEGLELVIILNDNTADDRDISWIYDVDFESFYAYPGKINSIYVSGTRAEDMALRLEHSGFDKEQINTVHDYRSLLDIKIKSLPEGSFLNILPTYTAMLDIRKIISRKYKINNIWE